MTSHQIGLRNSSFFEPFSSSDFWRFSHAPIFLKFDMHVFLTNNLDIFSWFFWFFSSISSFLFQKCSVLPIFNHAFLTIFSKIVMRILWTFIRISYSHFFGSCSQISSFFTSKYFWRKIFKRFSSLHCWPGFHALTFLKNWYAYSLTHYLDTFFFEFRII